MIRRHWKWLLLALVVVVAAAAGLRVMKARKAQDAAVPAAKAEAVVEFAATDVLKAAPVDLSQTLPVSGSLRAVNSAFVKARAAGELQGLTVREGDTVKAGQVLARIDATESRARVRQASEQAGAAKAQVDIAQRTYDNNKALVEQGFISRTALDTSQASLNAARSSYQAALAAADMAKKTLDDTVLQAPISGVVAQRLAQPGERVAIDGRVVEIVDLSRLELEATLSAADSVQVRVGHPAQLQVEGMARPVAARVVRINPSAQAGSRSVLAYLALDDATGLRQGLFAQGQVATGSASALAVPLSAIRTDKPSPYVQLVDDGKIVHRPVTPGARGQAAGETWVGVDAVPAGALVVKGHVGPLREGTTVKFTGGSPHPNPLPQAGEGAKPTSAASGAKAALLRHSREDGVRHSRGGGNPGRPLVRTAEGGSTGSPRPLPLLTRG